MGRGCAGRSGAASEALPLVLAESLAGVGARASLAAMRAVRRDDLACQAGQPALLGRPCERCGRSIETVAPGPWNATIEVGEAVSTGR